VQEAVCVGRVKRKTVLTSNDEKYVLFICKIYNKNFIVKYFENFYTKNKAVKISRPKMIKMLQIRYCLYLNQLSFKCMNDVKFVFPVRFLEKLLFKIKFVYFFEKTNQKVISEDILDYYLYIFKSQIQT